MLQRASAIIDNLTVGTLRSAPAADESCHLSALQAEPSLLQKLPVQVAPASQDTLLQLTAVSAALAAWSLAQVWRWLRRAPPYAACALRHLCWVGLPCFTPLCLRMCLQTTVLAAGPCGNAWDGAQRHSRAAACACGRRDHVPPTRPQAPVAACAQPQAFTAASLVCKYACHSVVLPLSLRWSLFVNWCVYDVLITPMLARFELARTGIAVPSKKYDRRSIERVYGCMHQAYTCLHLTIIACCCIIICNKGAFRCNSARGRSGGGGSGGRDAAGQRAAELAAGRHHPNLRAPNALSVPA